MRLRFSLRELETFVAIADYGTFAAAGEAIGLTQSAISLQIRSLEHALDAELFDRSKRPLVMNSRGLKLVRPARAILNQCQSLVDNIHEAVAGGSLRIGVIPSVMSGILPQTLRLMRETHPQLKITLSSGLSAKLVSQVNHGSLDAAIVTEPAQLGRGMSWHAFAEEPLVLIAPRDAEGEVDTQLLTRYPFIQFHPETYAGRQILTLMQDRGIQVDTRMNLDSLESISSMVANGLGVSVVPQRNIEQPFPEGIRVVPFGAQPFTRVIGLVERASNPKHAFVKLLAEALIEQAG